MRNCIAVKAHYYPLCRSEFLSICVSASKDLSSILLDVQDQTGASRTKHPLAACTRGRMRSAATPLGCSQAGAGMQFFRTFPGLQVLLLIGWIAWDRGLGSRMTQWDKELVLSYPSCKFNLSWLNSIHSQNQIHSIDSCTSTQLRCTALITP
ncbi:hypothetical protein C8J56DRAFT_344169 [Mycena floridula]|nr:hypothetical protein C8J56DRAFT_344169 [Mycena floridula]